MKTFQQFLEESKVNKLAKKIAKQVKKDVKRQQRENPDRPARMNYGDSEPNSIERRAAIMAMMKTDSDWRKEMKERQKQQES